VATPHGHHTHREEGIDLSHSQAARARGRSRAQAREHLKGFVEDVAYPGQRS
jgi:hypothetical protein